jgi:hypothetical protein
MTFLDEAISALNSYLPEPYRIPDDRRQWWALQICAHVALILVFSTLVLCVSIWIPDAGISLSPQFFLDSLDILIPGLFLIQVYYVPMYFRYLRGRDPLWKFFSGPFLVVIIGLLIYPIYLRFLAEIWAQMMLLFALAVSGLMFAEAAAIHLLFKWWVAHSRTKTDLLPPPAGRLHG